MDLREQIERRRTFAIISHPDAGKTTLTEKLLLYGGAVNLVLTAGMLCLMFLPNAARKLTELVLRLLVKLRLVRKPEAAREKLERQLEEYRRGAPTF